MAITTKKNLSTFEWPVPPYFQVVHDGHHDGPETCLVYLKNGSKALGELIRFAPEEASILFLPTRSVQKMMNMNFTQLPALTRFQTQALPAWTPMP